MAQTVRGANARIGIFLPSLSGGGAERVMITFANELTSFGAEVDLVVGMAAGPYRNEVSTLVRVFELGSPRVSRCFFPLVTYLRQRRPRWLLSTMMYANIVAVMSNWVAGGEARIWVREANTLSKVLDKHSTLSAWGYVSALKVAYSLATGVVAPSQGVADDLCDVLGPGIRKKMHVLMNPIPTTRILEASCEGLPVAFTSIPKPWIVGCGRLFPQKGFDILLRAFAELETTPSQRPSLIILGEGPERDRLTRLAADLGCLDRFYLPGFVANPFCLFRQASVFVLSSNYEGCPNALLQAMVCGASVVSTDCPSGPREILTNEAQGLLVPVGDAVAMSKAMARQLANPGNPGVVQARAADFAATPVTFRLWQLLEDVTKPVASALPPRTQYGDRCA